MHFPHCASLRLKPWSSVPPPRQRPRLHKPLGKHTDHTASSQPFPFPFMTVLIFRSCQAVPRMHCLSAGDAEAQAVPRVKLDHAWCSPRFDDCMARVIGRTDGR